ncbi:hypothetical protein, partial [Streptomyces palmae]
MMPKRVGRRPGAGSPIPPQLVAAVLCAALSAVSCSAGEEAGTPVPRLCESSLDAAAGRGLVALNGGDGFHEAEDSSLTAGARALRHSGQTGDPPPPVACAVLGSDGEGPLVSVRFRRVAEGLGRVKGKLDSRSIEYRMGEW